MAQMQHLWHGTQSGWLPGIVTHGLGGQNPHSELGTKQLLHQMVRALEEHGAELTGPAPGIPNELQLVAGTVPPVTFSGRSVNFEYGATYVSLDEKVASLYSRKFCGELFEYAWVAALRLDKMGLHHEVPDWRGWGLIQGYNIPVLLRLPRLPIHRFESESGENPSNRQRRMLCGTDSAGANLATDLTFRLKGEVPADDLIGLALEHGVPFCVRCLVSANPLAFPALPKEPVAFNRDALPPKGIQVQIGAYPDCQGAAHRR